MRLIAITSLTALLIRPTLAGLFGGSSSSASSPAPSSSSSSSDPSPNSTSPEVSFLLTLQSAQITSLSCLITLVNMTTSPIGSCLGLTDLSALIVNPNTTSSFSDQLNGYLTTVCGTEQCSSEVISDAQDQLGGSCSGNAGGSLVLALGKVLEGYGTSYRTLACSVKYNGTSDLCLPSVLNTSTTANNNKFFNSLIAGDSNDLSQYSQSVFQGAACTGCMYEMYKAAVFTISALRSNSLTTTFGDHLKNDCPNDQSTGTTIDWKDVEDQQIPDALQVQQSTGQAGAATRVELGCGWGEVLGLGVWVGMVGLGGWGGVMRRS